MATPPKPASFTPDGVPVGFDTMLVPFAAERPGMVARALHFHTNGASVPMSVQSQWNYAVAKPHQNTLPHYAMGLSIGGHTPAAKFLQTNRRGIGSTTVSRSTIVNGKLVWPTLTADQQAQILAHPNVREQTIVVETADTGYLADPSISPFDDGQVEACATLLAYEAEVHGLLLEMQTEWWGPGVASHTDPYGFPYTTIHRGKICPGNAKKDQVRDVILPRAREILAAWNAPAPTPDPPNPDEEADMAVYLAYSDTRKNDDGTTNPDGKLQLWRGNKVECYSLGDPDVSGTDAYALTRRSFTDARMKGVYLNPLDGRVIDGVNVKIPTLHPNAIRLDVGTPRSSG